MMKKYPVIIISILVLAVACKNKDKQAASSENSADAARNFIRAALDGKFGEASNYMLQDSLNLNYLDVAERSYKNAPQSVKDGYRASSIRFYNPLAAPNDSVSILVYSNSYKNDPDTLKVVRINNNWLVDLKYLYQHDADTALNKQVTTDSLK